MSVDMSAFLCCCFSVAAGLFPTRPKHCATWGVTEKPREPAQRDWTTHGSVWEVHLTASLFCQCQEETHPRCTRLDPVLAIMKLSGSRKPNSERSSQHCSQRDSRRVICPLQTFSRAKLIHCDIFAHYGGFEFGET